MIKASANTVEGRIERPKKRKRDERLRHGTVTAGNVLTPRILAQGRNHEQHLARLGTSMSLDLFIDVKRGFDGFVNVRAGSELMSREL